MKTILTFLSLCFCATIHAQDDSAELKQNEETPIYTPFAWYLEQEKQKEEFLQEKLDSLSLFNLKNHSKDEKKIAILLKMPIHEEPKNMPVYEVPKGLSLMPTLPIDTTNTYYLKVYPAKE